MKPFLVLQLRPEPVVSDDEFSAFLEKGGLKPDQVHRLRLERETIPADLSLSEYAGVIVGGGPGCVSDPNDTKDPLEKRIEDEIMGLMPEITENDIPYLGCCYGIGILAHHLGAPVNKENYGEPVSVSPCVVTPAGQQDPLLAGVAPQFGAFVGHKEAVQSLPDNCVNLVESAPCPFQMIRYKSNVYATQFHPEADGDGFELRIRLYRNKGYFAPHEADDLIRMCQQSDVDQPERILRNFVTRYQA